jgi:hypothetical protein
VTTEVVTYDEDSSLFFLLYFFNFLEPLQPDIPGHPGILVGIIVCKVVYVPALETPANKTERLRNSSDTYDKLRHNLSYLGLFALPIIMGAILWLPS